MFRVFLACGSTSFCERLSESLRGQGDFDVFVEASGARLIQDASRLRPDLVILGMKVPPLEDFKLVESLKVQIPKLPVFLVTELHGLEAEREALSHGIDAVFESDDDLSSLVMNARAACSFEWESLFLPVLIGDCECGSVEENRSAITWSET
jgi:DNA-binding NarL/FixJ family response regulator